MIEVVKPVTNEEKHELVCCKCGCLLRYEDDDLEMYGSEQGIVCPECSDWNMIKKYPAFQFPISFYHFSKHNNAFVLSDEDTQKYIDDCIKRVKESQEMWDMAMLGTGDTLVVVTKNDEEITCYVAKNYYEAVEFLS